MYWKFIACNAYQMKASDAQSLTIQMQCLQDIPLQRYGCVKNVEGDFGICQLTLTLKRHLVSDGENTIQKVLSDLDESDVVDFRKMWRMQRRRP